MCSGIFFLIGLILTFKGSFRFADRDVPKERGRWIGLILMLPLILGFLYGFMVTMPRASQYTTLEQVMSDPSLTSAATVEILGLLVAVASAAYLVFSLPKSAPSVNAGVPMRLGYAGGATPTVMTPAEAAAYLRIPEFEVIALIEEGKLPAARISGDYRIARVAVDDFLRSQQQ